MTSFGSATARLSAVFALCCIGVDAFGHARSESYSNWRINGNDVSVVTTVAAGEVTALVAPDNTQSLAALFAAHLVQTVGIGAGQARCRSSTPAPLTAPRGFVRVELSFSCGAEPDRFQYSALFELLPGHVHYARVFADGEFVMESLVTASSTEWVRATSAEAGARHFTAFLTVGVRHILSGLDHIAFLLGMLLVAGTARRSFAAVTGFTLGHSASLAAAVFGFVQADGQLVEALIGFTVALVAVEYFLVRRERVTAIVGLFSLCAFAVGAAALYRGSVESTGAIAFAGIGIFAFCYLLASTRVRDSGRSSIILLLTATVCFGLIHGFGFAGFLLDTGRLGTDLAVPLFGFNLGVELGQLALVVLYFAALKLLERITLPDLSPAIAGSLCGIGVFWFVGRSLAI